MNWDDEHLRATPVDQILDDVKKMISELSKATGVPAYMLDYEGRASDFLSDVLHPPEAHPNCRCTTSYVTVAECDAYAQYVHCDGEIPLAHGVVLLTYKPEDHHPEFRARLVGLADVHGRCWRTRAADWQAGQLALLLERVENVEKGPVTQKGAQENTEDLLSVSVSKKKNGNCSVSSGKGAKKD